MPNGAKGAVPGQSRWGPYGEDRMPWALWLDHSTSLSRRRTMQKESRVALVRHHPETALSATCGRSIHAVVLHTVAKRA